MNNFNWSNSICGMHKAHHSEVLKYMPELIPVMASFPNDVTEFVWDVKIHMLMPRQYPCIPNWHSDLVPRDHKLLEQWDKIDPSAPMYLWISNEPLPEFFDGREVKAQTWVRFNQLDTHRGTESKKTYLEMFHKSITCIYL